MRHRLALRVEAEWKQERQQEGQEEERQLAAASARRFSGSAVLGSPATGGPGPSGGGDGHADSKTRANLQAAVFGSVALIAASMMRARHNPPRSRCSSPAPPRRLGFSSAVRTQHRAQAVTVSALPLELVARAEAAEPFDVIVLSIDVEGLIRKGKVEAASQRARPDRRRRRGARRLAEARFQHCREIQAVLLNAKSIATSGEGSSGRFVAGLIERLGIADRVKPKIKSGGPGRSAQLVAAGEIDFVVSGLPP